MCNSNQNNDNKDNKKICYLRDFIEYHYIKDESDPFADEWNSQLIKFILIDHDSRSSVKYGMEILQEDFEIYQRSSLSKYCNFDSFNQLRIDCKIDINNQLVGKLYESYDMCYDLSHGNGARFFSSEDYIDGFKNSIIKINSLSINDIQIEYLISQLFIRWNEFKELNCETRMDGPNITWKDFIQNYKREKYIDVFDFLEGDENLTIMMDRESPEFNQIDLEE